MTTTPDSVAQNALNPETPTPTVASPAFDRRPLNKPHEASLKQGTKACEWQERGEKRKSQPCWHSPSPTFAAYIQPNKSKATETRKTECRLPQSLAGDKKDESRKKDMPPSKSKARMIQRTFALQGQQELEVVLS